MNFILKVFKKKIIKNLNVEVDFIGDHSEIHVIVYFLGEPIYSTTTQI